MQPRVLTIYLDSLPECLDGLTTESFAQWTVVYNLADRLLEFGANGELTGNLATDWENVTGNPRSWRLRLCGNRTFHDGSTITADDVVSSLKLAMTTPNLYGSTSNVFKPDGVSKESEHSVLLTTSHSGSNVLEQLNMNAFAIRKKTENRVLYSGPYRVVSQDQNSLTLAAVPQHPLIHDLSYKSVIIKKLADSSADNADRLADKDTIILSRNGFLFQQQKLPSTTKMFPFAAGNTHILSLRPSTPNLGWIKASIHDVMFKKNILSDASHARPLNSFFPPGFVVNASVVPPEAKRPIIATKLKISVPFGIVGSGILDSIKQELTAYDIDITWLVNDSWKLLDDGDESDQRDGFLAACHLDNQDPVRLAKHYFTGPRRAIWQLPSFVESILDKASALESGLERDRMIRNFYKAVVKETACIPLFFCPMMVWSTGDVDLSQLEFYGNTFKFSKVKIGDELSVSREDMNLNLRMFAHDFKRPFSLIKTAGQLIESAASIEDIRRISAHLLPQMTSAMSSVDGMIRDLLQLENQSADRCNIRLALQNALDQALASYGKKNHPIEFNKSASAISVMGDTVSIERIFANLIHNALESAPESQRVWVHLGELSKNDDGKEVVTISVGNSGSYIEPEHRSKLFDTGYSHKGKGRGLGLSIVKSLVDKIGGDISVHSDTLVGTEFKVTLSVKNEICETTGEPRQTDPVRLTPSRPSELSVVLIEDDPFIREAWEMTWKNASFQAFSGPTELMEAIENQQALVGPATIVITDYLFDNTELTGADVISAVRARNVFKVLLASDYVDPNLSSLVDGSIEKTPIAPSDLFARFAT